MKQKNRMKKIAVKNYRDCWHKNKLLFIKIFNLVLLFAMLTRGRHVQYRNVVVQQPLSANSVISAACVSVAIVYICYENRLRFVKNMLKKP